MKTQSINIVNEVLLDDLKLERGNEIELYYQDTFEVCNNFIKIANIDGKIVIFTDPNKVSIEKWEGSLKYRSRIREIEEEQDELKEKAEKEISDLEIQSAIEDAEFSLIHGL